MGVFRKGGAQLLAPKDRTVEGQAWWLSGNISYSLFWPRYKVDETCLWDYTLFRLAHTLSKHEPPYLFFNASCMDALGRSSLFFSIFFWSDLLCDPTNQSYISTGHLWPTHLPLKKYPQQTLHFFNPNSIILNGFHALPKALMYSISSQTLREREKQSCPHPYKSKL